MTIAGSVSAQEAVEVAEPVAPGAPIAEPSPPAEEPPPPQQQQQQGEIVRAKVIRTPTEAEIRPLYPEAALAAAKEGKAVVVCEIALTTELRNCVVESEVPASLGFGDALIRATAFYRVRPPTYDGEPVEGGKIRIPMAFQLELPSLEQQAADRAAREPPRETAEQRRARLGPLRRADDVLWAPAGFAFFVGGGLLWALWPLGRRLRIGQFGT